MLGLYRARNSDDIRPDTQLTIFAIKTTFSILTTIGTIYQSV